MEPTQFEHRGPVKIIDDIQTVIARETASKAPHLASRLDDAFDTLLGPGVGDVLEKTYHQYVIQIGGEALVDDAEKLTWMRPFEISSAPELLALLPAGDRLVLVGRYWACTDEQ